MSNQQQTLTNLMRENAGLKKTIEKLTVELSRELTCNVEQTHLIRNKDKNLLRILDRHQNLILHHNSMESRFMVMADNINDFISILDENGKITYANRRLAEFNKTTVEEMIGKTVYEVMDKTIAEEYMQQIFYPVLSSRTTITQNTAFNIDGKKCYIECQGLPLFDDNGTLIGVMNVSYDKTEQEQRKIYQEIEQHINFLNALPGRMDEILKEFFIRVCRLDHVNFGGVYILNENTQCLELIFHYNLPDHFVKKVESYGRDTNQFKTVAAGFPVYDLIDRQPPDAQTIFADMGIKAIAVIPLTQGETILGCLNLASSVANPFTESRKIFIEGAAWRISSIIGLNLAHEKQVKTVEILNETISDLRVKQQLLIQKSKMESLGELSAGMAHEINQPLVIISLSIENILQKINAQQKDISLTYLRKKFDSMQLNVIRIQHIIDNLRIFARDQSGILFEKVNIGTVITSTLEMIGPQLKKDEIYFLRDNADENLFVLGNIFKLEQVLLNIFSNSIYAVNQKMAGDATGEYKKRIGINISASNDQIIINLYDNGVGIQADHLEKLFTPFFTTKREGQGTGLGLPIVYGIIKEMNGEIKVTSKPDEFTNVQLIFPAV